MQKILLIILLLNFIISNIFAQGQAGAQFLKIGVGSAATGMGNAYCSLTDDINSIYWNPGGLADIKDQQFLISYNKWFADIQSEYIAYVTKMEGIGVVGGAILYTHMPAIERTDINGNLMDETMTASNSAFILSYGRNISGFGIGMNLKGTMETLVDKSSMGYMLDVGIKYKIKRLKLGLTIQNIGVKTAFIQESDPTPLLACTGIAYSANIKQLKFPLIIAADVYKPLYANLKINIGLQTRVNKWLVIRAGYKVNNDLSRMSAGFTISRRLYANYKGRLDYAIIEYSDLGLVHNVSIGVNF